MKITRTDLISLDEEELKKSSYFLSNRNAKHGNIA